ncbi:DUF2919 family protein [Alteromonas sp. BMJM2]|uniref:DUF2919 family protein n=1 Tax=Alteromonas sp. BMJM2 TaxID=2954241 RepID=UPI0022B3685A|nr:DUF2919 family protein [Alteromonas sp. BMJM2]
MLKLPLKYYDESGRILPPVWLYSLLLLLCIDWLVFIFSVASRTQTTDLLAFFYPQKEALGLNLVASLPVLLTLVLISQRERLWKHDLIRWRHCILPFIQIGVLILLTSQVYYLMHHQWGFEVVTAVKILLYSMTLYVVTRSRHLKWMINDWATPTVEVPDKQNKAEDALRGTDDIDKQAGDGVNRG